jgi:hypothetical protein
MRFLSNIKKIIIINILSLPCSLATSYTIRQRNKPENG